MGSKSAAAPPTPMQRLPALDGIRGIAVLMVIGLHCRELLPVDHPALRVLAFGWSGVDLFFVLSGFLITGILLDTRDSASYFRTFYARRALRIFPLYFLYIGPALILSGSWHAWGWYVSYLANWRPGYGLDSRYLAHLWSLALEEQFYLVWPAVVWITPRRRLRYVCLALVPVALGCRAIAPLIGLSAYRMTPCRMDTLAMGAFAALAARDFPAMAKRWLVPTAALSAVALEAAIVLGSPRDFWAGAATRTIGDTALTVLFACLVLYCATTGSRVLTWRPLRVCGKYSYGMYVLQSFLLYPSAVAVFRAWGLPSAAGFVLYFVCASAGVLALAWISWQAIEQRFNRLKDRFPYAGEATQTCSRPEDLPLLIPGRSELVSS